MLIVISSLSLTFSLACSNNKSGLNLQNIQSENYSSERVIYESEGINISGILWLPKGPGPHPALVLVDGSGTTKAERLKQWGVERFTKLGFACLTYDKRGVGRSGGYYLGGLEIDIPLLAKDVVAGVNYLKTRKEIDPVQIGLLGASQAGWIIPVAASESKDVKFTVIWSGTTVTLGEENYYSQLTGQDPFWKYIYHDLSREEISRRLTNKGPSLFDPLPYLKKMNVPGLWVYGELDRSQPTRESVIIIDRLVENYGKKFTYKIFDGANHNIAVNNYYADGVWNTVFNYLKSQIDGKNR